VQELTLAGYQLDRSAYDYLKTMDEGQASSFTKNLLVSFGEKTSAAHIISRHRR
jgi:hypothetical protein